MGRDIYTIDKSKWLTDEQVNVIAPHKLGARAEFDLLDTNLNSLNSVEPQASAKKVVLLYTQREDYLSPAITNAYEDTTLTTAMAFSAFADRDREEGFHPAYLIPINVNGDHWIYVLLNPKENPNIDEPGYSMIYMDGMKSADTPAPYKPSIIDPLISAFNIPPNEVFDVSDNHQHFDGWSCGYLGFEVMYNVLLNGTVPDPAYYTVQRKAAIAKEYQEILDQVRPEHLKKDQKTEAKKEFSILEFIGDIFIAIYNAIVSVITAIANFVYNVVAAFINLFIPATEEVKPLKPAEDLGIKIPKQEDPNKVPNRDKTVEPDGNEQTIEPAAAKV